MKGKWDIKVGPQCAISTTCMKEGAHRIKTANEQVTDHMVQQDILKPQIEPTPWVSCVTYPVKPTEVSMDCHHLPNQQLRPPHPPKVQQIMR